MAKAEWGTKRTCQNCSARFYDLKCSPPVCPVCNTTQAPETAPRYAGAKAARKPAPVPAPVTVDDAAELEVVEDDGTDEEIIEDASELGDDDVSGVLPVEDEVEKEP